MGDQTQLRRSIERSGIVLTLRQERSKFRILFLLFWLTGWLIGGAFAGYATWLDWQSNNPDRWFMSFWMAAWAFGAFVAVKQVMWLACGKEKLRISNQGIHFQRHIPLLSLVQRAIRYDAKDILHLGWCRDQPERPDHLHFSGPPMGRLQVEMADGRHDLFTAISEEQANQIIDEITQICRLRLARSVA